MSSSATCFVFDLDDTLYLERDYVWSGFQSVQSLVFEKLRLSGFATAAWLRFQQGSRGNIFNEALQDLGEKDNPSLVSDLVCAYRAHRPAIQPAADVLPLLSEMRAHATLALITDGFSICQRNKIQALGITDYFDLMIVTDELGIEYRKPHSRAFEMVEQAFSQKANQFIYFGDNPAKDFDTPRARGWVTCRVRRKQGLHYAAEYSGKRGHFELEDLGKFKHLPSLSTSSHKSKLP